MKSIFNSLLVMVFLLISCTGQTNRKLDRLFECNLETTQNSTNYYLNIFKISSYEFELANGENVVKDVAENSGNEHYAIKFWSIGEKDNYYNFYNLHDQYKNKKIPINYIDDNGNSITPFASSINKANSYIVIQYGDLHLQFGGEQI